MNPSRLASLARTTLRSLRPGLIAGVCALVLLPGAGLGQTGTDPGRNDGDPPPGGNGTPPRPKDGGGGSWGGPGDTVPKGPGGGAISPGSPGSPPAGGAPSAPGAGGTPPPAGAPPAAGPMGPASSPTPGPSAAPVSPRGLAAQLDFSTWNHWWTHNRDAYLAIDAALQRLHPTTGDEDGASDPLSTRRAGLTWDAVYGEVVPAMLGMLETERDDRVRRELALALARIGVAPAYHDPSAERVAPDIHAGIRPLVAESGQMLAETGVIALGVLGAPMAMIDLAGLAGDTRAGRELCGEKRVPIRMRALACYGLGVAGARAQRPEMAHFAVHHLTQVLDRDAGKYPRPPGGVRHRGRPRAPRSSRRDRG